MNDDYDPKNLCPYLSHLSQPKSPFFLVLVLSLSLVPGLYLCRGCLQSCFFQHLSILATVEGWGRRVVSCVTYSRYRDGDY